MKVTIIVEGHEYMWEHSREGVEMIADDRSISSNAIDLLEKAYCETRDALVAQTNREAL